VLEDGTVTNLGYWCLASLPRRAAGSAAPAIWRTEACVQFVDFVKDGGDRVLQASCDKGDAYSCFYLATALHAGKA